MNRAALAAGLLAVTMTACTGRTVQVRTTTTVGTQTRTATRTVAPPSTPAFTPAPATSVNPLPANSPAPAGEVEKLCPYIPSGKDEDPAPGRATLADLEGDRVGRTTVLTRYHPVGCRFYFSYPPEHQAIADILPYTFGTAAEAHDALVLTAEAGHNPQSMPDFVPGVDGIGYQTRFYGPNGRNDWAFAFAKGRVLVVVHTQQDDVQLNAQRIAEAIVGKF